MSNVFSHDKATLMLPSHQPENIQQVTALDGWCQPQNIAQENSEEKPARWRASAAAYWALSCRASGRIYEEVLDALLMNTPSALDTGRLRHRENLQ